MITIQLGKNPTLTIGAILFLFGIASFLIIKIISVIKSNKIDKSHVEYLEKLISEKFHYMDKGHIYYLFNMMKERYPQHKFRIGEFNEAYDNVRKRMDVSIKHVGSAAFK